MIRIYEYCNKEDLIDLLPLDPFMGFFLTNIGYFFREVPVGREINDGKIEMINKIEFFSIARPMKGFVCDSFYEATELCRFIDDMEYTLDVSNLQFIKDYIIDCKKDLRTNEYLKFITVPVISFIKYSSKLNPPLLDLLDIATLENYRIDYSKFIKYKWDKEDD